MLNFQLLSSNRANRYLKMAFLFWDLALISISYILSLWLRYGNLDKLNDREVRVIWLLISLLWVFLVLFHKAYQIIRVEGIELFLGRSARIIFIHASIVAAFVVLLNFDNISRMRMLYFYFLFFLLIFFSRILTIKILKAVRRRGIDFRSVLIIGANANGVRIAKELTSDLSYGYKIVGFVDNELQDDVILSAPYFTPLSAAEKFIEEKTIDELYVAIDLTKINEIGRIVQLCERKMVRVKFIPDFQDHTKSRKLTIDFYGSIPVLIFRKEPLESILNRVLKRVFDVVFSVLVILLFLSWLLPILAIAITVSSPGPVFFLQLRSGENNRSFRCWKLRTMRVNNLSDELQASFNDPRITKLGAFMRRTNIDELPQFFNVLWGNMSVVGPRPHMIKHTEQYSELIHNYLVRHYAKPGITGWAQVNGFRGETKEIDDMKKRVEFDIWYIENWSFLLDVKIIWRTVKNMVKGEKNAY